MAKKKLVIDEMPSECCGACCRTSNEDGDLVCYGMPPLISKNDDGTVDTHRGAVVDRNDPPCFAFSKRFHA